MRVVELIEIKVVHPRGREWLAKPRHPLVPALVPHDRQALDVIEMFQIPFDILPQRSCVPALEFVQRDQDANPSMFLDQSFDLRDEEIVIPTV